MTPTLPSADRTAALALWLGLAACTSVSAHPLSAARQPPMEVANVEFALDGVGAAAVAAGMAPAAILPQSDTRTVRRFDGILLGSTILGAILLALAFVALRGRRIATAATDRQNTREQLARFALDKSAILHGESVEDAVRAITRMATQVLDVQRSGIWLYDGNRLRLADLYDRAAGRHEQSVVFSEADYPRYFAALADERTIDATDVGTDPRTSEFADGYFDEHGVGAVLDAPVRVGGTMVGIVCNESVGSPRVWTSEEQVLAASIADFVTQVLELAERRRAERAMERSERRYRAVFEQAAAGMAETSAEGHFLRANPRLQEILGRNNNELRELAWPDVVHEDHRAGLEAELAELREGVRASIRCELRCVHPPDGPEVWVDFSAAPVWEEDGEITRLIVVATDVSETRELQDQLIHAQRMDSIGRLAGGIAHDFNNLLTAILGHAELAAATVREDEPVYADLLEIEESAIRASSLTRQLLIFARRQMTEPEVVAHDDLTARAEQLLGRLIGEHVELITRLDAGDAAIRIDPGQYEQVVMNLAVNARDAMPAGGTLEIRSRVVGAGAAGQSVNGGAGDWVELTVQDSGTGMTETTQERLFEPFFTTKPPGEGTGLGLATCYGIVSQAGGSISAESELGRGTTFTILFPIVAEATERQPASEVDPAPAEKRTVLVAEDEEAVRRLVVESLRRQGYEVLPAFDGTEALNVADAHEGAIEVLVTDIVMPRMRGPEVAARLRESRPGVKVLFISGYSGSTDTEDALTTTDSAFLSKPFTPTRLAASVRDLIKANGA